MDSEVVWEYFAPWAPYDAERESQGSTIDSVKTTKTEYQVKGGSIGKASQQSVEGESHVCGLVRDVPNPAGFSTFIETKTSGTPLEQVGIYILRS